LGENLDIIDFERAIKTSGTRSYTMKGDGARLMRALRNYTLDLHISNGYCEILPPLLLNEEVLYGLGKIPFFEEDMYKTNDGQFLSATEEFPITAMYSNEIIDINKLPLKLTGASTS
jgi:seryl-tRNA synthetase